MSKQEKIAVVRAEIKTKERQIYRANKEMNAWSKSNTRSLANTSKTNLFFETQKKEISELKGKLAKLLKED
jgi:hypothetical protein